MSDLCTGYLFSETCALFFKYQLQAEPNYKLFSLLFRITLISLANFYCLHCTPITILI